LLNARVDALSHRLLQGDFQVSPDLAHDPRFVRDASR
jgi:hypothetical protein